jgi:hypothetical protein
MTPVTIALAPYRLQKLLAAASSDERSIFPSAVRSAVLSGTPVSSSRCSTRSAMKSLTSDAEPNWRCASGPLSV